MSSLYKQEGLRFFAASNTKDGFISYFEEIFGDDDCDRVYIIKGGPGCGKSTFMKKLGSLAENKGLSCEYFHCSSDPESLDGIIIKEKRIAVIDGTNPHATEPTLSGVREIIIDLGRAWNTDMLYAHKEKIQKLTLQKQKCYKDAYGCLYGKNVMEGFVYNLVFPHIFFDKLDKSVHKLSKSIMKSENKDSTFFEKTRITEALSSLGKIRFFTFEDTAESCIFIKEPFCGCRLSHLFMKGVYDFAKNEGVEVHVSFKADKKGEINALYFPHSKTSLSLYDEEAALKCDRNLKRCKIINCERFIDSKALSHTKPLRKFYSKLSENMENWALDRLSEAGKIHADIEKIYRQCTCYTTVENITTEYINKILNS